MIRHTVVFTLKHERDSEPETAFLRAAMRLAKIPTVKKFECLRQVNSTCEHSFGLSMEFDDAAAYQEYNEHPDHVAFVNEVWIPEVSAFQEIDYHLYEA